MKKKLEPMADDHVNVTPLIDIVMCLIIFFLICGNIAQTAVEGDVKIPVAKSGQELPEARGRLVINIVPTGDLDKEPDKGREIPQIKVRGQQIAYADLTKRLRDEVAEDKDLKVLVRADKLQSYEHIAPVLISCAQAKIKSVNFSTVKP